MFSLKNQDHWKPMFLKLAMFFLSENFDLIGMCNKGISCSKYTDFLKWLCVTYVSKSEYP